nr:Chain A, Target Peptide [synthetic construct]
INYWLAHAKAG